MVAAFAGRKPEPEGSGSIGDRREVRGRPVAWVALFGVPVLVRPDRSWVYLGIWAGVLLLGSVVITLAAWRLTATVNANRD